MPKKMKKGMAIFLVLSFITSMFITQNYIKTGKAKTEEAGQVSSVAPPTKVRLRSYKAKRLHLKWDSVPYASGYQIFQYKKKTKAYKKVAEVEADHTFWLSPKTKKAQTYKIRAYQIVNGTKTVSDFSYEVWAIPYNKKKAKKVNAGVVRAKQYQNKMGIYETKQMEVNIKASRFAKLKKARVFDTSLRWYTSDESIATVDDTGLVTTKGKYGTCQIYARAHNGNYTGGINITVVNYARPGKFTDVEYTQEDMQKLLTDYAEDLQAIAEYFERYNKTHEPQAVNFFMNDDRSAMETYGADIPYEEVSERLRRVLDDYPGHMRIRVTEGGVHFDLSDNMYHCELSFSMDAPEMEIEESPYYFRVATRWYYEFYRYA